jgi:transcriptional regulator with XRE-family HTH domain
MKNASSIAQFIKEKRKNLKITQEELAFSRGWVSFCA